QPTNPPVCGQGNQKKYRTPVTEPTRKLAGTTTPALYNRNTDCSTRNTQQATHTTRCRGTSYGGHSVGETPGPIPNPEAKTHSADGTAFERMWESRTPPDNTKTGRGPTPHGAGPPCINNQTTRGPL